MIYTFVLGANIPETVKVGDSHSWDQMYPHEGGYPGRPSRHPPKRITGTVLGVGPMFVYVEAEEVR